jgi:hypothetical protein
MSRALLIFIAVFFLSLSARAEYRAFLLAVTNTQTSSTRTVTTTLDDIQYRAYYPLHKFEAVSIQATWMCWERGGEGTHYCPNPRPQNGQAPSQAGNGATKSDAGKNLPAPTTSSPADRQPASVPR